MTIRLSVIVPVLNEERALPATLRAIHSGAPGAEVIVVDGGSVDKSVALACSFGVRVIQASRGRAVQMNAGAQTADGDVLAFVHADTLVPPDFALAIERALRDPDVVGGRFDVKLDDSSTPFRILAVLINLRSRLSKIATGDQVIFVRRKTFWRLGGFPEIELCEDLEFSRRLKPAGRIACLNSAVMTSARRWRHHGVMRTVLRMWAIKTMYLAGVSPRWLRRHYADTR
jgi:rSAM/selenodomain-associated transferase 2